jgi:hypothetical protein
MAPTPVAPPPPPPTLDPIQNPIDLHTLMTHFMYHVLRLNAAKRTLLA